MTWLPVAFSNCSASSVTGTCTAAALITVMSAASAAPCASSASAAPQARRTPRFTAAPRHTTRTDRFGRRSMWPSITSPATTGPTFSGVPE